jgi:lactoylglutathione lyase
LISGLFETHIFVTDLDRSTAFYRDVLGLELGRYEEGRRASFFWIGTRGEAMLGLWEKPPEFVTPQHFAFRASIDDIRHHAVRWLKDRGLACHNFLDDGTERPMVFAWMPALSIYFTDPDSHSLELIAMLPDEPLPDLGVVSWEEWEKLKESK